MNTGQFPDPFLLALLFGALALVPFMVVMVTAFTKIVVVLMLVRNALGIQQTPPNTVLFGLGIVLTLYISMPVIGQVWRELSAPDQRYETAQDWIAAANRAKEPFRAYLLKYTPETERAFFLGTQRRIGGPDRVSDVTERDFIVVIPAFVVKELRIAFQIGFLIFLPFLVIDMVISNILLAMGMMMLSPVTISLPFKILLFVLIDGWVKLSHGLVLSYA